MFPEEGKTRRVCVSALGLAQHAPAFEGVLCGVGSLCCVSCSVAECMYALYVRQCLQEP